MTTRDRLAHLLTSLFARGRLPARYGAAADWEGAGNEETHGPVLAATPWDWTTYRVGRRYLIYRDLRAPGG